MEKGPKRGKNAAIGVFFCRNKYRNYVLESIIFDRPPFVWATFGEQIFQLDILFPRYYFESIYSILQYSTIYYSKWAAEYSYGAEKTPITLKKCFLNNSFLGQADSAWK